MIENKKAALVISGGGAKGAWAVGALRYLVKEKGEEYDLVVGTSTGALIAPLVALGDIDDLVTYYTSVKDKDILGFRLGRSLALNAIWGIITGKDSVYSTKPLGRMIRKHMSEKRWQRLRTGPNQAWVSVVNMQTGKLSYFGSHQPDMTREKFIDAMLASASIPVFMSQARITGQTGYWFVDGGVKDLIPLGHAIRQGARKVTIIILGPEPGPANKEFQRLHQVLHRTIDLQGQETGENDISFGKLVTRELLWRERLQKNLTLSLDPDKVAEAFQNTSKQDEPMATEDRAYAAVSFSLLRPETVIGETLGFGPELMKGYEKAGYQFASNPKNWQTIPKPLEE